MQSQKKSGEHISTAVSVAALRVLKLPASDLYISGLREKIKKKYREGSRKIHPDKCNHPDATKAFAILESSHRILKEKQIQLERFRGKFWRFCNFY